MNHIIAKIFTCFYVIFGGIDMITRLLMKFCFQAEGGIYPMLLWNPIRLVPVAIALFGLTVYTGIKILKKEFSMALKLGIIIVLSNALSLFLDTSFIISFDYISPLIGYYLEIISLIFFLISLLVLLFYLKFGNEYSINKIKS